MTDTTRAPSTPLNIWLIGAGPMAKAYANVFKAMDHNVSVIGRGEASAADFEAATDMKVVRGGLDKAIEDHTTAPPSHAIIALPVPLLADAAKALADFGVKTLLIEKPAGLTPEDVTDLDGYLSSKGTQAFVAYNRRFYASVERAKAMIEEDGGVSSFRFEISEYSHAIRPSPQPQNVRDAWFYANTTHVLDMAFHLGGWPVSVSAATSGDSDWHAGASQYVGHGFADGNVPFSYIGDWNSAPRWMVEIYTAKRAITFQPLEALKTRPIDGFAETQYELDSTLDKDFKPGLFRQVETFLTDPENPALCRMSDHTGHMSGVYPVIRDGGQFKAS